MTAPTIAQNDAKTAGLWAFDRSPEWKYRYSNCDKKAKRVSPLNIDTSKIEACNALCRLSVNYKPSTCSISMINNIPTVTFAPTCIIKFKNEFLYLRKMTIHYTSMHTVDTSYADLEILLYHNRNLTDDSAGGIIISILLKKGEDFGPANDFLNQFINQMPANDMPIEQDIQVSDSWCPEQLFPVSKSFFYYDGALPYPPCTPKWTYIIFDETVPVAMNIIDNIKYILGTNTKNIRPIQRTPAGTHIFYNSNSRFDGTQDVSDETVNAAITPIPSSTIPNNLGSVSWLKQNIYYIKGIVISIILILMIYVAIKCAKVIVQNDLLNTFIIKQLKKKQHNLAADSQEAQAAQQAQDYGAPIPVDNVSNNSNNNSNSN